ncbi:supervillin isoform X1 [Leptinotarsa decemlineata]|uniref:supervillin isoform X1 n=1 Tax=Leptinotarsa decemlineata TaxID=7539 RepID=UPI003D30A358
MSVIEEMFESCHDDPCLIIDYHKFGRGMENSTSMTNFQVKRTKLFVCWKIIDNELVPIDKNSYGILFDTENYLIQWTFEFVLEDTKLKEETMFYYWRGCQSSKGLSPLPPTFNNENTVVERICQWSEPPIFFHILFPKHVIVFIGSEVNFDPCKSRLFMLRGELPKEIHLYELQFLKKNLRSRAIFLIVVPQEKFIYIWQGGATIENNSSVCLNLASELKQIDNNWKRFTIKHVDESNNDIIFKDDQTEYFHLEGKLDFTPRLFYFNSITEQFSATEVQYSLRSTGHVAAFPFLQSHLYSAEEPALFLLDNNTEIWLWKGQRSTTKGEDDEPDDFIRVFEQAKITADGYAKLKERIIGKTVSISYVEARSEPIQFTNIFPYWNTE